MTRLTADARLRRILAVVPWVVAEDGPTLAEVCARFGYSSEAELQSDLNLLFVCGVPPYTPDALIEVDVADGRVWIRYADWFARPLRLTAAEALTLVAASAALLGSGGAGDLDGPPGPGAGQAGRLPWGSPTRSVDVGPRRRARGPPGRPCSRRPPAPTIRWRSTTTPTGARPSRRRGRWTPSSSTAPKGSGTWPAGATRRRRAAVPPRSHRPGRASSSRPSSLRPGERAPAAVRTVGCRPAGGARPGAGRVVGRHSSTLLTGVGVVDLGRWPPAGRPSGSAARRGWPEQAPALGR